MNKYLWIYLSFFATLITAISVIIMKYLTDSKSNVKTLTFMSFIISSFIVLIYLPFDKTVINDVKKNIDLKDYLLIILFSVVLIANRLSQVYVFKITPSIGISHLIINANIIVSLLAGYFLFKQMINYKSFIGILITMIGLSITIYYSNN
jgi:drug/metabolite transporter (DMT)-like permease